MPVYEFEKSDGSVVEKVFSMASVPASGSTINDDNGNVLTRIISGSTQVDVGVAALAHGYPYTSNSLPKNLGSCKKDNHGRPIITSRRHERELQSRYGLKRD